MILQVVLYGCVTSYGKNIGLRVLENRMLRNLFGHKRKGGTAGWSKLDNEELHYLHPSPNI